MVGLELVGVPAPVSLPHRAILDVTLNIANEAVLTEGQPVLINNPNRFDGVKVLVIDEDVWDIPRSVNST